jgi:hypothetical protein
MMHHNKQNNSGFLFNSLYFFIGIGCKVVQLIFYVSEPVPPRLENVSYERSQNTVKYYE